MSNVVTPAEFQQAATEVKMTVSQKVSRFAESFSLNNVPKEIVQLAKLHVLDLYRYRISLFHQGLRA